MLPSHKKFFKKEGKKRSVVSFSQAGGRCQTEPSQAHRTSSQSAANSNQPSLWS